MRCPTPSGSDQALPLTKSRVDLKLHNGLILGGDLLIGGQILSV